MLYTNIKVGLPVGAGNFMQEEIDENKKKISYIKLWTGAISYNP